MAMYDDGGGDGKLSRARWPNTKRVRKGKISRGSASFGGGGFETMKAIGGGTKLHMHGEQ